MKLSKEKHTRSAVANNGDIKSAEVNNGNTKSEEVNNGDTRSAVANEEQNIGGILYRFPGKSIDGVKDQMLRRDKEVKKLYNVFNQIQVGTKPKKWNNDEKLSPEENERRAQQKNIKMKNYKWREACSKYVESSQRIINDVIFYSYRKAKNKLRYMRKNEDILKKMQEAEKLSKFSSGKLEDFVAYTLRKSLVVSKYDTQEFDSVAAMVVFLECIGKNNISDHEREIVCKLLELIRKDFSKLDPNVKGSQGANIVRSVRNQNMIVQPQGDRFLFPQVYAKENETVTNKNVEKEGLNEFLLNYANLDDEKMAESLRKLRRILDVYFSAPNHYEKDMDITLSDNIEKEKFNVWEKHECGKKETGLFVDIPDVLMEAEAENIKLDAVVEKRERKVLNDRVRKQNIICYRYTRAVVEKYNSNEPLFFENNAINQYWIHHIENAVERILKNCKAGKLFKLRKGYLAEKVWKDAINLISIKYIALGKAVYNFALDDIWKDKKNKELGIVDERIRNGITSFDYEMIKAHENLQRELAVDIAFSVNNLARAVCDMSNLGNKESDFLLWKRNDIADKLKNKDDMASVSAVLQFFGGKSSWDINIFKDAYKGKKKYNYEVRFIDDLRKAIYCARNENFHFKTALVNDEKWNTELFGKIFERETEFCLNVEKDRFYSNNLYMFYQVSELRNMLDHLYSRSVSRAAQVPSYNSVIVRTAFPEYITNVLGYQKPGYDADTLGKWYSACYYLLKEIYYNSFLQSDRALQLFEKSVKTLSWDDKKQQRAVDNFKDHFSDIKSACTSLAQVCQIYMTEYNQQNNQIKKVRSSNDSIFDQPVYQHYKVLLKKAIANAFADYLKNNKDLFGFIGKPFKANEIREIDKEQFLPDWTSRKYEALCIEVSGSQELQKWYIVGKFLNARSLNLMVGSMRSYIQYVTDIKRRAASIGNELHVSVHDVEKVEKWVQVIEVCSLLASRTSNQFEDYFNDKDDYARYLKSYVDFSNVDMPSEYSALVDFSNEEQSDLYVDPKNPKVNRNIVHSKLFAADHILRDIVEPVSKDNIEEFYSQKAEIAYCKIKGKEITAEEQKAVLKYQKLKNRVELRDIVEYGEIINELLGQLINWSFMRERDLLYFQLGFHYDCLRNDSKKPEGYKNIKVDENSIKDAILYQIIGMYVNGVTVYAPEKDGDKLKEQCVKGGVGVKVSAFHRYSKYLGLNEKTLYNAGLEIFEVVAEHEDIINLRNGIDHFKYYLGDYRSMLSIYSEVFDRFFTYDIKYQKNVLNLLQNILLRHNVIVEPILESGFKTIGEQTKPGAKLSIRSIKSDTFQYKVKGGTLITDAKDERYLETIRKILYYAENEEDNLKKSVVVTNADKYEKNKESDDQNKQKEKKNKDNKGKKNEETKSDAEKNNNERLSYNPFANLNFKLSN